MSALQTDRKVSQKGKSKICNSSSKNVTESKAKLSLLENTSDKENQMLMLRSFYARLLSLCNENLALRKGSFFDLMYVNPYSHYFNPHSQYAFLRHAKEELLLIVVNFAPTPAAVHITIPKHAFDYLSLPILSRVQATDLLNDNMIEVMLEPDKPIPVTLQGTSGVILRIPLNA